MNSLHKFARRLYLAATVVLLLTSLAHTIGHFSSSSMRTVTGLAMIEAMRANRLSTLGLSTSTFELWQGFSLNMSVMLLWLGLLCLVVRRDASLRTQKRLSLLCGAFSLGLCGMWLSFGVAPPAVFHGLAGALFVGAGLTLSRAEHTTDAKTAA